MHFTTVFTVFEITPKLLFISYVCENVYHRLLFNNGNFCTINIILYTMTICYFNVFVFSIYSYTLDVKLMLQDSSVHRSQMPVTVVAAHAPRMFEHVLRCLLLLHCSPLLTKAICSCSLCFNLYHVHLRKHGTISVYAKC